MVTLRKKVENFLQTVSSNSVESNIKPEDVFMGAYGPERKTWQRDSYSTN